MCQCDTASSQRQGRKVATENHAKPRSTEGAAAALRSVPQGLAFAACQARPVPLQPPGEFTTVTLGKGLRVHAFLTTDRCAKLGLSLAMGSDHFLQTPSAQIRSFRLNRCGLSAWACQREGVVAIKLEREAAPYCLSLRCVATLESPVLKNPMLCCNCSAWPDSSSLVAASCSDADAFCWVALESWSMAPPI